jgi:hypothetical protein
MSYRLTTGSLPAALREPNAGFDGVVVAEPILTCFSTCC